MREIKFRWFMRQEKKMFYPNDTWFLSGSGQLWVIDDLGNFLPDPFLDGVEIMQYTGLKDKNGKEIYEGDILQVDGDEIVQVVYVTDIDDVPEDQWDNVQRAGFNTVDLSGWYLNILASISEVIGNIYENKELLK